MADTDYYNKELWRLTWGYKVIGVVLFMLIIVACTPDSVSGQMLSNASTTSEVIELIEDTFMIGQTSPSEIVTYIQNNELDCTEWEDTTYDPNFSDQEYESSIVCMVSATSVDTPSTGNIIADIVNDSVSNWSFRIAFLFKEELLVDVKVSLNDSSP